MSWSLVGQIVVLTLLAIVVLIVVAGFVIGIYQHTVGKPEEPEITGGQIRGPGWSDAERQDFNERFREGWDK